VSAIAECFDDSEAYERFMGSWSRAACSVFLEWVAAPSGSRWLDVGCGTGILVEKILEASSPAAIVGVDPSLAQVEHAARRLGSPRARFQAADAQALPFADAAFDVVAAALAINFIPDRPRALAEMRRVARAGGIVAGFVWDFAEERSPSWPMRKGLRAVGAEVPAVPGTADSRLEPLCELFGQAGLTGIETRTFEVSGSFPDFDDFWQAQMPSYSPMTRMIAAMPEAQRAKLKRAVREALPVLPDGALGYAARANAIKAFAPQAR
jgi:SAM-dependent methyltransferase